MDYYDVLLAKKLNGEGGGGGSSEWVRPADWPDYSTLNRTGVEAVYFTMDCRPKKAHPDAYSTISLYVTNKYKIDRGYISNGSFVSVASTTKASADTFSEELPTDEGDFVVYRVTPQSGVHITCIAFGNADNNVTHCQCLEVWGNAPLSSWITYAYRNFHIPSLVSFDVTGITSYSGAFNDTHSLQNFDGIGSPTSLNNMFASSNLANVDIDWTGADLTGVTSCSSVFNNSNVRSVKFGDGNTSAVTFASFCQTCKTIRSVELGKWKPSSTQNMFNACNTLFSVDMSKCDMSSCTNVTNMFYQCYALSDLKMPPMSIDFAVSFSTHLTHDSLMQIINNLETVESATLAMGNDNLNKLTAEEKAIATDKGWTLA